MARLLFKLGQVPDDEAQAIRDLLDTHGIVFYETDAGFWRVGLDAIWLPSREQEDEARALIADYQAARTAAEQENYAQLVAAGEQPNVWQVLRAHPLRFVGVILAVGFVLTLTLVPFLMLLQGAN